MGISSEMIQDLLSLDATTRKAAEVKLQSASVSDRIVAFIQVLTNPSNQGPLLHLSAVLLRRDILTMNAADDLKTLQDLMGPLLQVFASVDANTKTAVGNCLAEIVAVLDVSENTKGLGSIAISQILGAAAESASHGDLPSLQLIVALSERAPASFAQVALPSLPQLIETLVKHPVFHAPQGEVDPNWPDKAKLYGLATEIVTTTAIALGGKKDQDDTTLDTQTIDPNSPACELGTRTLLPLLTINNAFSDPETVAKVLPLWMQAAQSVPEIFVASDARVWEQSSQICLNVVSQDHNTKLAIQAAHVLNLLVISLKNQLPQDIRQNLMNAVLPRLMTVLLNEVDSDVEGWTAEPVSSSDLDKDTFGDDDGECEYAYEQMVAWVKSSPALAMSVALPLLESQLLGNWSQQWAAMVCVQSCVEAAPIAFTAHIPTAMQAALQLANSPNARVTHQAIQLLGVMCDTGHFPVWDNFGERILQAVTKASLSSSDRVKAMACSTLASYCRPDTSDKLDGTRFIVPYLNEVLRGLVEGPLSGPSAVQSRAVLAVICLANAAGSSFAPFYSMVMPGLLSLAQHSKSSEYEDIKLQATAIESATIIGQVIGEENSHMYENDATRIMQWVIPVLQQGQDESINVPMGQLLSACARIATVAGEAYAEYAKVVVPLLIQRASKSTDVEITDGDVSALESGKTNKIDVDQESGKETVTLALPGKGLTKLTISTHAILERVDSIRGLYEHAIALEGSFAPYVNSSFDVLFPLINFTFAADVRTTAAQSLSAVYEAACCYGENSGDYSACAQYLSKLVLGIAEQIKKEDEMDALYAFADALSEVLFSTYSRRDQLGPVMGHRFTIDDAKRFVGLCLRSALVPCLERRLKITQILNNAQSLSGEDEREAYSNHLKEEEKLLTPLVDSVGYTLKIFGPAFFPVFQEEVASVLGPCLSEGNDIRARLSAVCLYDDCAEWCGPAAANAIAPDLIKGILLGLNDDVNGGDVELKQAAVYGVVQLARFCPTDLFTPHAQSILTAITAITNAPKESAPSLPLYENCIAALACLCLVGNAPLRSVGAVNELNAMTTFMQALPLSEDPDLAQICHDGFYDLIIKGQVSLDKEAASIARISGDIMELVNEEEDVATEETCEKIRQVMQGQSSPTSTAFF